MKKGLIVISLFFVIINGCYVEKEHKIQASKVEAVPFVIDKNKPMVAITYDDGPHQEVTSEILDVLEEHHARATFFPIGNRITHHAEIIKRMLGMNCEIGNHTYGHVDLSKLSANEIEKQLSSTATSLASILDIDYPIKVVRPPFGNRNQYLLQNCHYPIIVWSIDTRDWSHQNAERSIKEVMNNVQDGDIILMHDMYEATAQATREIVKQLTEQGYQLVTVSEMFEYKGIDLKSGTVYQHAH